jgi:hypothetical protein|nr:MAG TPA_asm: hypothetical protein [Caudoviricetes sp.]
MLSEGSIWYKHEPTDKIWWKDDDSIGSFVFSFDRVHEFNMFQDYPEKLTKEQKAIFDAENPYWRDYFLGKA